MQNEITVIENTKFDILNDGDYYLNIQNSAEISIEIADNVKANIVSFVLGDWDFKLDININVGNDSKVKFNNVDVGLNSVDCKVKSDINKNSEIFVYNLVINDSKDVYKSYDVINTNVSSNSKSEVYQKAIVKNEAEVVLKAVGKINKGSVRSENFQESRVLLLNKASKGEASPLLLIDEMDVVAGHKASVSRIDDESFYYLQTRGMDKRQAEALLVQAFVKSIIDKMDIQDNVKALIDRKMNVKY